MQSDSDSQNTWLNTAKSLESTKTIGNQTDWNASSCIHLANSWKLFPGGSKCSDLLYWQYILISRSFVDCFGQASSSKLSKKRVAIVQTFGGQGINQTNQSWKGNAACDPVDITKCGRGIVFPSFCLTESCTLFMLLHIIAFSFQLMTNNVKWLMSFVDEFHWTSSWLVPSKSELLCTVLCSTNPTVNHCNPATGK